MGGLAIKQPPPPGCLSSCLTQGGQQLYSYCDCRVSRLGVFVFVPACAYQNTRASSSYLCVRVCALQTKHMIGREPFPRRARGWGPEGQV